MTETNINALCSVEAVFDGVDIEVTVEFSAGGGTFEHDELTAESREKANQHPISAITGLQFALDGKSNVGHGHNISDITNLTQQSITGLKVTDSPEFADTQITTLAAEATYTPTVWTYLVGLFTTVPKSALQHLVKLWGVVNNLAVRVGLLEDKYILRYVVPVNTNYIDLTLDKNGNAINIAEGETFEIIIPIREWVNPSGTSRINLRFNGVASNIYRVGNTGPFSNMMTQGSNYFNNDVRVKLTLVGGNLHGHTMAYQENPKGTFVAGTPQMYGCRTDGYSFSAINRIELLVANANEIPAGVVILLKKI